MLPIGARVELEGSKCLEVVTSISNLWAIRKPALQANIHAPISAPSGI